MSTDGWKSRGSLVRIVGEAHDEVESVVTMLAADDGTKRTKADFGGEDAVKLSELLRCLKRARAIAVDLYFAAGEAPLPEVNDPRD